MPDLAQFLVIALGLVPGFIASEVQSFVALRHSVSAFEKTLIAVVYSAGLYGLSTLGQWGPQFANSFRQATGGDVSALLSPDLLARYLLLASVAGVLGVVTGRSLAHGRLRNIVAWATGRDLSGSAWQQFFHDRPHHLFWVDLGPNRRLAGQVISASDQLGERYIVLAWPKWVLPSGHLIALRAPSLLVNMDGATLIAEIPDSDRAIAPTGGG